MRLIGILGVAVLVFGSAYGIGAAGLGVLNRFFPGDYTTAAWWLLLPAAIVGLFGFRAAEDAFPAREKSRRKNRCATCDYDLRGNVSGICPECGTPVTPGQCS